MKEKLLVEREGGEVRVSEDDGEEKLKIKVWREMKKMWVVAGPAIFTRVSTFGIQVITQAFVGHLGATQLAAYALVATVILRFANGILLGMASALETLCGQAFGAKQYHMLGVYLQRSWLILLISTLLLLPVFIFTAPILKALGQSDTVSDVAQTISLYFIPVMYSFVFSFTCQMFLQAQSKNKVIGYFSAFSLAADIFLCWLLTVKFKYGLGGAMVAIVAAYWIPNVGQLSLVFCGCRDTWRGFSSLALKDLWPVIKLSVSSGVMLCLELWYNTVLILLTGSMSNAEVAIDALSICLNISGGIMMIALGFLAAASVRVSNELGRGNSKSAKFSIVNVVITSFVIGFVLCICFLIFRGKLAYIFTDSDEVAEAVAELSPLLACSILLNSIQPVLSGVAVGAGRQSIVAYVNLTCYYLIGVPIGAVLGYILDLQVKGVWIGMLFGTLVQTIVLIIITCRTDWEKQVLVANERMHKWVVPEADEPNQNSESA